MSFSFIADIIAMIVGNLVTMGILQQSQADAIMNRFVMPIEDDMAL